MSTITCAVCHTENHHLALTCSSCGGFLQRRADNLDLFATGWTIIESPLAAMRGIALAKHKNYSVILSSIAGIALTFFIFWLYKMGDHAQTLLNILGAGIAVGPLAGIVLVLGYSAVLAAASALTRSQTRFRNIFAVTSYAMIPIVLSVIVVFPLEIMTYGAYFFTSNPSPWLLKPASYILLLSLDGIFALWSIALLWIGIKALLDLSWSRAAGIAMLSLLVVALGTRAILQAILPGG